MEYANDIEAISEMIGMRVRHIEQNGSVISVSLKNEDFYSYSHQRKLDIPTSSNDFFQLSLMEDEYLMMSSKF